MNNIKLKTGLGTSTADTFVQVPTAFISDMAGNAITIIRDGRAQQVLTHTVDTTRPSITSFQIRSNGKVTLKFSESVLTSSFNTSAFVLQNVDMSSMFRLTTDAQLTSNALLTTQLTLTLNQDFVNAQSTGVAITQLTSYMSCSEFAVTDMAGNRVNPISSSDAVLMGPALESYNLDMERRRIDFSFSENVNGNFSAGALTLYDGLSGSNSYTLTDWNFTADPTPSYREKPYFQANSTSTVTAWLSAADVIAIKRNGYLATARSNTYLSVSSAVSWTFNEDLLSVGAPLQVVPIIPSKVRVCEGAFTG